MERILPVMRQGEAPLDDVGGRDGRMESADNIWT